MHGRVRKLCVQVVHRCELGFEPILTIRSGGLGSQMALASNLAMKRSNTGAYGGCLSPCLRHSAMNFLVTVAEPKRRRTCLASSSRARSRFARMVMRFRLRIAQSASAEG